MKAWLNNWGKGNKLSITWVLMPVLVVLAAVTLLLSGCGIDFPPGNIDISKPGQEKTDLLLQNPPEELDRPDLEIEEQVVVITIGAVGDIMGHMPHVNAAFNREEATYDFRGNFVHVKEIFQSVNLMIGNLETTLAGQERGFSGYPRFNTPDEMADALAWAGFDVLSTANNHSLDKGEQGVLRTLEVLRERGLIGVGTAASQEERNTLVILERNDIKVGFLAYTYGTNGLPIPRGKDYLVNLIDESLMADDIARLRVQVDVVVVSMHWGDEYVRQPNDRQKELAAKLVSLGADIILGSHPHVLQPMEFIEAVDNDGNLRKGFVIYSLGNFISNQRDRYRDSGVILLVDIMKNLHTGTVEINQTRYVPTWVHKYYLGNKWNFRILPVEKFISVYYHGFEDILRETEYKRLVEVWQDTTSHLGESWHSVHP
jgi:poly-gamma-glutamate synthesis protein (capsule biosynthesis protein)